MWKVKKSYQREEIILHEKESKENEIPTKVSFYNSSIFNN